MTTTRLLATRGHDTTSARSTKPTVRIRCTIPDIEGVSKVRLYQGTKVDSESVISCHLLEHGEYKDDCLHPVRQSNGDYHMPLAFIDHDLRKDDIVTIALFDADDNLVFSKPLAFKEAFNKTD